MAKNTPTTEHVKAQYARQENYDEYYEGDLYLTPDGQFSAQEFDRWLTEVKREAWKEGAYWHSTLSGDYEKYYRGHKGNPYTHEEEQ